MKEWLETWVDLLTQGEKEKIEEFEKIRSSSPSLQLAIMKYRRLEKERGRGQHIQAANDIEGLQELFLEPILQQHIDYLHERVKELKIELQEGYNKIYQMHLEDKGKRFLYLVNTL